MVEMAALVVVWVAASLFAARKVRDQPQREVDGPFLLV